MPTNQTGMLARFVPQMKDVASRVIFRVGQTSTRLGVLSLLVLGLLYLLYQYAWQPLTQPTELPAGVTASALVVDSDLLQRIITQRINRVQAPRQNFTTASGVIVPPPRFTPQP